MASVRVLYVDDEPDIRDVVEISLGLDPAFAVRSFGSGTDAIAATAEWTPDLILLDVVMPGMDGPTTLARLRDRPRTAKVPVVFVTARAQAGEIDKLHSLGAAGVISKPFDPMTLPAVLRRYAPAAETRIAVLRDTFLARARARMRRCWPDCGVPWRRTATRRRCSIESKRSCTISQRPQPSTGFTA
jgi:CheY-like chemotaxis protein